MSKIRLYGATSGYVELAAPAAADDGVLTLPTAAKGFGKILQVVSTTKTDSFSASVAAGAVTDITGLTVSITPKATNSTVLLLVEVSGTSDTGGAGQQYVIRRGSTDISVGDAAGNRSRRSFGNADTAAGDSESASMVFVDSPATTSSTTYSVRVGHRTATTQTVYVNRSRTDTDNSSHGRFVSTITALEIGA